MDLIRSIPILLDGLFFPNYIELEKVVSISIHNSNVSVLRAISLGQIYGVNERPL